MSVKVVAVLLFFISLVLSPYSIIASKLTSKEKCKLPCTVDDDIPDDGDVPCFDGYDIVQIQSIVSSSMSRWSNMIKEADNATKWVKDLGPDSHFGFATFGDKNLAGVNPKTNHYHILGPTDDHCLHVDIPLEKPDTKKMVKLFKGFQKKEAAGRRGDWFDSVFEGVYRTVIAPGLNWRPKLWNGKKIQRVVLVIVDTVSHLEGDVLKLTRKKVRPFDITETGMKKEKKSENYDCNKVDYPSVKQLAGLLNELEVDLVMLVSPGGTYDRKKKFTPFEGLASMGERYRHADGLKRWYEDQLRDAGAKNFHVLSGDPDLQSIGAFYNELYQNYNGFRCENPVQ